MPCRAMLAALCCRLGSRDMPSLGGAITQAGRIWFHPLHAWASRMHLQSCAAKGPLVGPPCSLHDVATITPVVTCDVHAVLALPRFPAYRCRKPSQSLLKLYRA